MSSYLRVASGLICLLTFTAVGCGGKAGPDLVPAKGVLTLDGKPLVGATIVLHPDNKKTREGVGLTDDRGTFVIRTAARAGAIPGHYKVTVQYYTKTDGSPLALTEQERQQGLDITQLIAMGQAKSGVPSKYTEAVSTDVQIEIRPATQEPISVALVGQ